MAITTVPVILVRTNPQAASITLWDNTGVGDGTNFPNGWQDEGGHYNTSNPMISDINSITIEIEYPDSLTGQKVLDAGEIEAFMTPSQGLTLVPSDIIGTYDNFPDGIPIIRAIYEGDTIAAGNVPDWSIYGLTRQAMITFLENYFRNWVLDIPTPTVDLNSVLDPAMANLMLDQIYYAVQFSQIEKAQEIIDFLTEMMNAGTNITDYKNDHNL